MLAVDNFPKKTNLCTGFTYSSRNHLVKICYKFEPSDFRGVQLFSGFVIHPSSVKLHWDHQEEDAEMFFFLQICSISESHFVFKLH